LGAILQGVFTPQFMQRFGITVKMQIIATCATFTAFLGAMSDSNMTLGKVAAFAMISLTSQGVFESLSVSAASLEVDPKDVGQALGTQMSFRNLVTAVGSKWHLPLSTVSAKNADFSTSNRRYFRHNGIYSSA